MQQLQEEIQEPLAAGSGKEATPWGFLLKAVEKKGHLLFLLKYYYDECHCAILNHVTFNTLFLIILFVFITIIIMVFILTIITCGGAGN